MPYSNRVPDIQIRDARLGYGNWRNFSGRAGRYNKDGARSFTVFLDDNQAEDLRAIGWNVKDTKPRNEDDDIQHYLNVKVNMNSYRPPKIYLVTKKRKQLLSEDSLSVLDSAEFEKVDLVIHPYAWDVNGKQGITAYLNTGYFTIVEDVFADDYADVPEDTSDVDVPF